MKFAGKWMELENVILSEVALTKEVKNLYDKNFNSLKKEIEEDIRNGRSPMFRDKYDQSSKNAILPKQCKRLEYDMITVILQHIIKNSIFNLTETSCFWRIKHNEEDDGDLRNDCEISLMLSSGPIEEDDYTSVVDFRLGLFMVFQISWIFCVTTFLDLVFSLTDESISSIVNSLLKKRVFTNPIGELVDMNLKEKQCADYDIYNIWNFPHGFGLKVKIGGYSSYFPESQQLHISEELEQTMGATLLPTSTCSMTCSPGFRKFHEEQKVDCCFDCALCPENEVSNETDTENIVKLFYTELYSSDAVYNDVTTKKNCRPISLMNTDAKIINYWQTDYKNTSKLFTMIKYALSHRCKDGSTYESLSM
ncbi:hypothetical protein STEG23_020668 [Scotinomys teguina]